MVRVAVSRGDRGAKRGSRATCDRPPGTGLTDRTVVDHVARSPERPRPGRPQGSVDTEYARLLADGRRRRRLEAPHRRSSWSSGVRVVARASAHDMPSENLASTVSRRFTRSPAVCDVLRFPFGVRTRATRRRQPSRGFTRRRPRRASRGVRSSRRSPAPIVAALAEGHTPTRSAGRCTKAVRSPSCQHHANRRPGTQRDAFTSTSTETSL